MIPMEKMSEPEVGTRKDTVRPAVFVASALHLLSSSALNGISPAKSQALLGHLSCLIGQEDVDPLLQNACFELFTLWQRQVYRETQPVQYGSAMPH